MPTIPEVLNLKNLVEQVESPSTVEGTQQATKHDVLQRIGTIFDSGNKSETKVLVESVDQAVLGSIRIITLALDSQYGTIENEQDHKKLILDLAELVLKMNISPQRLDADMFVKARMVLSNAEQQFTDWGRAERQTIERALGALEVKA